MSNKNTLKILYFILIGYTLNAQTYQHTSFWSRLGIQKTIKNFDFRVDFDLRQQNDFQKSKINPFQKSFLRWARLNTTYNTGNFSHTIIWPNIIKSYPLIATKADLNRPSQLEWRTTLNEEFTQNFKKLEIGVRLGYEFRNITANNTTRKGDRIRLRLSETLKITTKTSLNSSFEYLWNAKASAASNPFNQSQLAFRFIHTIHKNIDFTTGLNHVFRQRNDIDVFDVENAILCNFLISL